ncbi:MAG: DUF3088 domain-containing protein [Sphingomonas adhaesiva]|uniref:DUF3088 domain-containing protein n=1 Tax=Sphingomonas adhaesiva TaxID=28212 RepID=UPI002FFD0A47
MKDALFLMKPGFVNAGLGPFYCGDSVSVEGMLGFFPELRDRIDVHYIDFPRPRRAIADLIGADHQSVPVLILADDAQTDDDIEHRVGNGRRFIDDEKVIRHYLSRSHGLPEAG